MFFAPRDNPQIAGVVLLEHGMHGPNAASLAHHVLETFFAKQDGKPLPPPPTDMRLDLSDPMGRKPVKPSGDDPEPAPPVTLPTPIAQAVSGPERPALQ